MDGSLSQPFANIVRRYLGLVRFENKQWKSPALWVWLDDHWIHLMGLRLALSCLRRTTIYILPSCRSHSFILHVPSSFLRKTLIACLSYARQCPSCPSQRNSQPHQPPEALTEQPQMNQIPLLLHSQHVHFLPTSRVVRIQLAWMYVVRHFPHKPRPSSSDPQL